MQARPLGELVMGLKGRLQGMNEYSWRDGSIEIGVGAWTAWSATCEALPVGTRVTGEVIGRQRFGVFLRIDGAPDAVGLAEITAMPRGVELRDCKTFGSVP